MEEWFKAEVQVIDNGPGFPVESKNKLFEEFSH
ncbi:MAG: signal transduction histidine kinase [Gammaproteobacteria bacterium]|jgi:signal transduction histidine kinase